MDNNIKIEKNFRDILNLYESFNDEEYFHSKCFSYSKIKDLHSNPEILLKEEKKDTKSWFTFGTIVDMLLTEKEEIVKDKIVINNKIPSAQFVKIANYIIENYSESQYSDIKSFTDEEVKNIYSNSGSNVIWKIDTMREKMINNLDSYLSFLVENKNKIIVEQDFYNEAVKIADVFRNHKWSSFLFMDDKDQEANHIELIYQYKIKYTINDSLKFKSKIDVIRIDHDLQTISPFDIKTGTDKPEWFLNFALYEYKYGYQGALYREGLEKFIDKIPELKGYTIDNFRFVYVSRLKPYYPVILQMDDLCHNEFLDFGISDRYYNITSLRDLFDELDYYIKEIDLGKTIIEPYELIGTFGEKVSSLYNRNFKQQNLLF